MTSNFLNNACTRIQNMAFKTSKMDQIALEYCCISFLRHLRVDGRVFFHQKPIFKTGSPDQKARCLTCSEERVTGPLMKMFQSAGFMTPTLTSHFLLKLYYSWSSVGHLWQNLPGTGLKIHLFIVWNWSEAQHHSPGARASLTLVSCQSLLHSTSAEC